MLRKILAIFILLIITAATSLYWFESRDPIDILLPPEHGLKADITILPSTPNRQIEHVTLHGNKLCDIGFVVNLPADTAIKQMPVIIVLGGLVNGQKNISYITKPGNNIIISYDWPIPVPLPKGMNMVAQAPELYKHALLIPGQISSAIRWASEQPWADNQRISLLGFSLGALAAPSVQHLAEHDGIHIGWTIIAYGGAPLGELVAANHHLRTALIRNSLAGLVDFIFKPLEPTRNLPYLSGHFLVLEGLHDDIIPEAARNNLEQAVPQPKEVITFNSAHMGVGHDKIILLQQIIDVSETWLIKKRCN